MGCSSGVARGLDKDSDTLPSKGALEAAGTAAVAVPNSAFVSASQLLSRSGAPLLETATALV